MNKLLLLISFFAAYLPAIAGPDPVLVKVLDGYSQQLKVDSFTTVRDDKYFNSSYNSVLIKPYRVDNTVSLKIHDDLPLYFQSSFTATVKLRITSILSTGTEIKDVYLTVQYDSSKGASYNNINTYAFKGGYEVEVKVLERSTDASWDVWSVLMVENALQSFPQYNFSCSANAITEIGITTVPETNQADELPVSWPANIGADEYDLEWTYIDSAAMASGFYGTLLNPNPTTIFSNNASRVTISGTSYNIPLLYDGKGVLFFRVRAVKINENGSRTEAYWSSTTLPGGLGKFEFAGHERKLNWQATTSFAEDGKRKSVVQYYDGSLRSRQTVTKDNSTGNTIVAESIYDYQGRPTIQVLPAPTLNNMIGYSRKFNIGLNGNAYDKDDFDLLPDPGDYCTAAAAPMKNDSGAARYYSPSNPLKNDLFHRFIPDAEGYPFTETQYTQDNTGRISSQSGVGVTHKLNSGHETKYYYGSPDQEELDALFGTEAGNSSHYFKNMVRDANGQYSVSYIDMHGRTIATALSGVPATKMDPDGITAYAWSKVSGGPAVITTPNQSGTTVTDLEEGEYVFRLMVKDPLNSVQFSDVTVTVNKTPGAPSVNAGADQSITLPTSSITLSGSATDEGGTITSYTWSKLSGGTSTITTPNSASTTVTGLQQGNYVFRLTVQDNTGAIATGDVHVAVYPNPSVQKTSGFNLTKTAVAVSGWTNAYGEPHASVINVTDAGTGFSLSSVATANWNPYAGTSAYNGGGVNNGSFFPAQVMINHWYQHNAAMAGFNLSKPQFEISGLTVGMPYTIRISGSNIYNFISNTRYTVAGFTLAVPVDINTKDNAANGAVFSNIIPDALGKIRIYVNTIASPATELANIAGIQIIENSPYLSVSAGADQLIKLPTSSVSLQAATIDPQGTVNSYNWVKLSGGAATITSPTAANTTVTGLEEGNYIFRLTVRNNQGATASSDVQVSVYPEATTQTAISFNFSDAPVTVPGWINLAGNPHLAVRTATDPVSNITLNSVATANWNPYAGTTAYNNAGANNGTFFPAEVMKHHWYQYDGHISGFDINKPQFQLSGLTPGTPYTIKMTGSNGTTIASPTRYTVVGVATATPVDVNTMNNTANGAVFSNVLPANDGTIKVYVNTIDPSETWRLANISGLQVIVDNLAPQADAGQNQLITLPVNYVTLSGSGIDPEAGNRVMVTRRLIDSSNNIVRKNSIVSSKSLLVTQPGVHYFKYSLLPDSLRINDCNASPFCYNCSYKLNITITDDCNNQKLGGAPFDTTIVIGNTGTTCDDPIALTNLSFSKFLEEGNYLVTKTLTIDEDAQNEYREAFLIRNTCKTLEHFIEEQRSLLPHSSTCKADCLCDSLSSVKDIRNAMLLDLTPPSGQYANPDIADDPYSIFYIVYGVDSVIVTPPVYSSVTNYKNEDGEDAEVFNENTETLVSPSELTAEAFSQKFSLPWAEALLPHHPEYCKLRVMEGLQDSYDWERRFEKVNTYAEALSKGYLNPAGLTGSAYNKFAGVPGQIDLDPLATKYDSISNSFKANLTAQLLNYRTNNISGGISIWGFATITAKCHDNDNTAATACFNSYSTIEGSFNTSTMCEADIDMAWRSFREMYLAARRELINARMNILCPGTPSATALLGVNHQPYFGDASAMLNALNEEIPQDTEQARQEAEEKANTIYEDNCKAYVKLWWEKLRPCNYSAVDSAIIIPRLIEVCKEGSDIEHPYGSSSVKPSSTYPYRSFEEVIDQYNQANNITNIAACNAYGLTSPKPYDKQIAYSNKPLWLKPSDCECEKINLMYNKYTAVQSRYTSFADYLKKAYNTTIHDTTLTKLRNMCAETSANCNFLVEPIQLPPVLQCGVGDVCVDCKQFTNYDKEFKQKYPGVIPYKNPAINDSVSIQNNLLYERFMNFKTGFSKSIEEYIDFSNNCGIKTQGMNEGLDSLLNIVNSFRAYYYPDTATIDTVHFFANDPCWHTRKMDYPEIFKDGQAHIPSYVYNNCTEAFSTRFFKRDTLCVGNDFTIKMRLKSPIVESTAWSFDVVLSITTDISKLYGGFMQMGHPYLNDTSASANYAGISLFNTSGQMINSIGNLKAMVRNFDDWQIVTIKASENTYKIYFNDTLVSQLAYTGAISKLYEYGVSYKGVGGYMDWIKIYDSNNNLQYIEEFEDCKQSSSNYPAAFRCPKPECTSAFTSYYNTTMGTSYTYTEIDSIYYNALGVHLNICSETQLLNILEQYQSKFITPSTGYVDLDIRTFGGNKTPQEGPKGVFDVNGNLIDNTVDSTAAEINKSYAQIWNSSPVNQAIGTLTTLSNGKFRLALKPGQQAPCNGIIGMRYYQFDTHVYDTMNAIGVGLGSYVDFGDGTRCFMGNSNINEAKNIFTYNTLMSNFYEQSNIVGSDYIPYRRCVGRHIYNHTNERTTYTVTVYHTDLKGFVSFRDTANVHYSTFTNLRGYFPQNLLEMRFAGTRDSTINTSKKIKNFSQISSIQTVEFEQSPSSPFLHNNFESFENNHNLRRLRLVSNYFWNPSQGYFSADTIPLIGGKYFSENFPNFKDNFKDIRFLIMDGWYTREADLWNFSFENLSKLQYVELSWHENPAGLIDSVYNQLVRSNPLDSGRMGYGYGVASPYPTSASTTARNLLKSKGWKLYDYISSDPSVQGPDDIVVEDKLPYTNAFTEYFNAANGTNYSFNQLDSLYQAGNVQLLLCPEGSCNVGLKFNSAKKQRITIPRKNNRLDLGTGNFTLEAKIKPLLPATHGSILSNRKVISGPYSDGFMFIVYPDGKVSLQMQGCYNYMTGNVGNINLYDGKAHHVAAVRDIDSVYMYVDGIKMPVYKECTHGLTIPPSQRNINSTGSLYIGIDAVESGFPPGGLYNGWIEDVRIWNIARTQGEISYNIDNNLYTHPNLVGYYTLSANDTCEQIIVDHSTNVDSLKNNGFLGHTLVRDSADPIWLSPSQISYNSTDPENISNKCKCTPDTTNLTLCGRSEPLLPPVSVNNIDNCSDSTFFITSNAIELYNLYKDSLKNEFDLQYRTRCLEAYRHEIFTVTRPVSEYHYTLYYYDQAGNLVKTVPPAGVDESKFRWSISWSDSVTQARLNHTALTPNHKLITQYRYNTLNQVVSQQTPDAGRSDFWYDRLGRLSISQNAKQKAAGGTEANRLYSYTLYDYLGRIAEAGELKNLSGTAMSDAISRYPSELDDWLTAATSSKSQITTTIYDLPYAGFTGIDPAPIVQRNLRNRVSYTSFSQSNNPAQYNHSSFFSYDIHGNVDTLLQDYGSSLFASNLMNSNNNRFKKMVYRYDLISGKVNHIAYQPKARDQFYHRYNYDAENRLTSVETSPDSIIWQKDASYEYYLHGPLARTVLGQQKVQGLDYAYTLQGWLKGVNSTSLKADHDMGEDGLTGSLNQFVAHDAVGFNLNYFDGDYKAINAGVMPFPSVSGTPLGAQYRPLYNGNISSMAVNIGKFGESLLYNYKYDRLNRLTQMDAWKNFNASTNSWSNALLSEDYKERIAYDGNGNILKYLRNTAGTTEAMDSMSYKYYANTNRLSHIKDNANPAIEGIRDIEDQPSNNYSYDAIGNLVSDISENIPVGGIQWNVYGKITAINRSAPVSGNNTRQILYGYDASGNRISKRVSYFGNASVDYTWYVRDASGNVMSVYTAKKDTTVSTELSEFDVVLSEQHLYGSSRLGLQSRNTNVESALPDTITRYFNAAGLRYYELANHLGNVLATVSDKKLGVVSAGNSSLIDHFEGDVVSANDYYPFGMGMSGRQYNSEKPRYTFNGKEMDRETGYQDYGFRIYDPRIGKFLSVDPLTKDYAFYTPYQFAGNKPILATDLDGLEENTTSTYVKKPVSLLVVPKKEQVLPVPKIYFFQNDRRSPSESQKAREYAEYVKTMNRMYNSDEGWSFRIFAGVGAAAVSYGEGVVLEYAVGKGVQGARYLRNSIAPLVSSGKSLTQTPKALNFISTPYGQADQAVTKEAFNALEEVNKGATLYRIGTLGRSAAGEAQFWSLENPADFLSKPEVFAAKFGIPAENLKSSQLFIESGKLQKGANFITRPAPGVGANGGGAIEVVTNPGSVKLEAFNVITPKK